MNKALDKVNFKANESSSLIFYDSKYSIIIERLEGLYLRTLEDATPTTEEVHDCGLTKDFYLYKFSPSTVSIVQKPSWK